MQHSAGGSLMGAKPAQHPAGALAPVHCPRDDRSIKRSTTQMSMDKIRVRFCKQGGKWMALDRQARVPATPSACLKKG